MANTIDEVLQEAVSDADIAFWKVIKKTYPEITTGHLDIQDTLNFREACKRVVIQWLEQNSG